MRYLLAIFFILCVVLGFGVYYYHNRASSYCELWKNSQANIDYLIKQRKKDYADTLAISIKVRELEEAAKMDKSTFDWNFPIASSAVILRLQSED